MTIPSTIAVLLVIIPPSKIDHPGDPGVDMMTSGKNPALCVYIPVMRR